MQQSITNLKIVNDLQNNVKYITKRPFVENKTIQFQGNRKLVHVEMIT